MQQDCTRKTRSEHQLLCSDQFPPEGTRVATRITIDSVRLNKLYFRTDAISRQHDTSRKNGTFRTDATSWQHLLHGNMLLLGKIILFERMLLHSSMAHLGTPILSNGCRFTAHAAPEMQVDRDEARTTAIAALVLARKDKCGSSHWACA